MFFNTQILARKLWVEKVIKKAFIDKTDSKKRFVAVQVRFVRKLKIPVSLEKLKNQENFHLPLIKQSRLSVMPLTIKAGKLFVTWVRYKKIRGICD